MRAPTGREGVAATLSDGGASRTSALSRRAMLQAGLGGAGAFAAAAFLGGVESVAAVTADGDILANLAVLEDQAVYVFSQVVPRLSPAAASGASSSSSTASASASSSTASASSQSTGSSGAAGGGANGAGPGAGGGNAAGGGGVSGAGSASSATSVPAGGAVDPVAAIAAFQQVHSDHRDAFVQAVKATEKAVPVISQAYPSLVPPGSDQASMLTTLGALEAQLLGAMYGALTGLGSVAARVSVASAFAVTARLQAILLLAQGQPPVPVSFVTGDSTAAAAVLSPRVASGGVPGQ